LDPSKGRNEKSARSIPDDPTLEKGTFSFSGNNCSMPAKAIEQPWTKVVWLDREIKYSRDTIG
jgi:hypothetical protein